jgi:hypothetical protein
MNKVDMKPCSANFVYHREATIIYELQGPSFTSGYAKPFNIAIKQACSMSFDVLKTFDLPLAMQPRPRARVVHPQLAMHPRPLARVVHPHHECVALQA